MKPADALTKFLQAREDLRGLIRSGSRGSRTYCAVLDLMEHLWYKEISPADALRLRRDFEGKGETPFLSMPPEAKPRPSRPMPSFEGALSHSDNYLRVRVTLGGRTVLATQPGAGIECGWPVVVDLSRVALDALESSFVIWGDSPPRLFLDLMEVPLAK